MNGRTIIAVIGLFSDAFDSKNVAIKTVAQAAACQYICTYCYSVKKKYEEDKNVLYFNELLPIMQFICCKIKEIDW